MVGGYRFAQTAIDALVAEADPAATIMVVPGGLLGEHLAGHAPDPQELRTALQARGVNPLIGQAFPKYRRPNAA